MHTRDYHAGDHLSPSGDADPAHLPRDRQDRLRSARDAALWLSVNPRTAQVRARRAFRSEAPIVRIIAGAYYAPEWWWQQVLAKTDQNRPSPDAGALA